MAKQARSPKDGHVFEWLLMLLFACVICAIAAAVGRIVPVLRPIGAKTN
jgi:hypothetical protein